MDRPQYFEVKRHLEEQQCEKGVWFTVSVSFTFSWSVVSVSLISLSFPSEMTSVTSGYVKSVKNSVPSNSFLFILFGGINFLTTSSRDSGCCRVKSSAQKDSMSVSLRQKSFSDTKWSSEPSRAFVTYKILKTAVESTIRGLQAFANMDIISSHVGDGNLFLLACSFLIISAHSLFR